MRYVKKFKNIIFLYRTFSNSAINRIRFTAPRNPCSRVLLDPHEILYKSWAVRRTKGLGQVRNGSWDLAPNIIAVDDYWKYNGLIQRYKFGFHWRDTDYFAEYFDRGWSEEKINERCVRCDNLFNSMRGLGYVKNPGGEVLITINRSGDIGIYDRWHRMTMARCLNIPVYAQVLVRHHEWQKFRDKISKVPSKISDDLRRHPDLLDLFKPVICK